jgi:hypothetical protein
LSTPTAATALPRHRFDPCVIHAAVGVDKYQTVAFDSNRYSVPRPFAFQMVTVKGYVAQVVIVAQGQVVARHERCLQKQAMILDPLHYLATLGRKPGAFDHAPVFRDWQLPACFAAFRVRLEQQHGPAAGVRQFARVLQLLGEHPLTRVSRAVEICLREQHDSAEAVLRRTQALAALAAPTDAASPPSEESSPLPQVDVPRPDLQQFDQLLSGPAADNLVSVVFTSPASRTPGLRKESVHDRCHDRAAQDPTAAVASADDGPRV